MFARVVVQELGISCVQFQLNWFRSERPAYLTRQLLGTPELSPWPFDIWGQRTPPSDLVKHPPICTCGGLRLSYACAAEERAPFHIRVCPAPSHCQCPRPCVRSLSRVPLCDPMACSLARLLCLFLTQWIPEEDCHWEADLRLAFQSPRLTALWITPLPLQT